MTITREIQETLKLGWPIILGNVTQIILGVIDSAMVGAIHSSQLAASAFVNNLISLPMILGLGMTMAISPLVATAMGEGDREKPLRIMFNGLFLAGVLAVFLATVMQLGIGFVDHMGQDEIVATLSKPYLSWMLWGMVPMVLFLAIKQFADGLGFTRGALYVAVAVIPLNILLNYVFIFGKWGAPRMELTGAGVGTLVSRLIVLMGMMALIAFGKDFRPYRQNLAAQLQLRRDRMWDVLRIGIPSSLQYGMESAAFAFSGIMVGWLGYVQQAAHQIALSFAALTFMVALGISAAGSIRVAYAYGKKDWPKARNIGTSTIRLAIGYGVLCALMFVIGRHTLPLVFNDEPAVLAYAASLFLLAGVFQISDSVQAVGVGLLRGLQDVRVPTFFVGLAYWVIGVPAGYLLAFVAGWEVLGIWTGFVLGLSASAILLSSRFVRLTVKRGTAAL